MSEFDVIVVGGGPAGAACAALCARRGRRVALVEHKRFPRHKVCGDVINPNCWPVLERLGVAGQIRALPHHTIDGATFSTSNGAMINVPMCAIAIRRSLFDSALLEHARACGVTVFEGETVHEIEPGWRVRTADRELTAKVLVGADGRHSVVARKTGLLKDRKLEACATHGIALQAHFRATRAMDDRVQLHLFPGGYCGVVRVDAGSVNLCIVTDAIGARWHGNTEELFARTVWQNPVFRALGIAPEPIEPLQSAHPLWAPMNRPAREGVFLVGDALRVVEPFTGQGIFFALRTGELAAEAICVDASTGTYTSAVAALYRRRARTNEMFRRLMYRDRLARTMIPVLRRWPGGLRLLAGNVLNGAA